MPDDAQRPPLNALAETVVDATVEGPPPTDATKVACDSAPVMMLPAAGYDFGELIGRGGMGEVVSAHDRRIGRDVAIKRMRADAPTDDQNSRFLREARVQARLDHPAIVPVHELGVDEQGRPYFTMKRLAGVTLAQRISEGWSSQRLLSAFADICLAIEFAHARGVVHRDLKPANVMLGDFGEVYVLDWGIARVLAETDESIAPPEIETLDTHTKTGDMLGTPGYMAPEQIRGLPATAATDVYALGAMLFEILTGEPLHPRGTPGIAHTLSTPQQLPSKRIPDEPLAPELDLACFGALAEDPEERPTARVLGERVQRYLDGDRDLERRRTLAIGELAIARAAYESNDPEQRAVAMQSAGRALALDPRSVEAAALVTRLMVEPPKQMPQELADEIDRTDKGDTLQRARITVGALLSVMAILLVLPWLSIRSWTTLWLTLGALVAATGWIWVSARRGTVTPFRVIAVSLTITIAFTRVVGSFMLTPAITAGCLFAMTANPWLRARRWAIYVWLVVATMLPLVLEAVGVFRPTNNLGDGGMCVVSPTFRGQGLPDAIALIAGNFLLLFAIANFAIATNRQITAARHELRAQAWHLHQLLPKIT